MYPWLIDGRLEALVQVMQVVVVGTVGRLVVDGERRGRAAVLVVVVAVGRGREEREAVLGGHRRVEAGVEALAALEPKVEG